MQILHTKGLFCLLGVLVVVFGSCSGGGTSGTSTVYSRSLFVAIDSEQPIVEQLTLTFDGALSARVTPGKAELFRLESAPGDQQVFLETANGSHSVTVNDLQERASLLLLRGTLSVEEVELFEGSFYEIFLAETEDCNLQVLPQLSMP